MKWSKTFTKTVMQTVRNVGRSETFNIYMINGSIYTNHVHASKTEDQKRKINSSRTQEFKIAAPNLDKQKNSQLLPITHKTDIVSIWFYSTVNSLEFFCLVLVEAKNCQISNLYFFVKVIFISKCLSLKSIVLLSLPKNNI
jgi:hypothetical protein